MGRFLKRAALALLGLVALGIVLLLALPAAVDPVAYTPPEKPALTGPLAPNQALRTARKLAEGRIHGPEDVAVDGQGRVYGGTNDGRIQRLRPDGSVEDFALTGGRPLGLRFDPAGNLIVCDAVKGLLAVDPQGRVSTLVTEASGVPVRFADGVDVATDGNIYFSDASTRYGVEDSLYDLLEARPHGRLIRYDPAARTAAVLLTGLYFANGVALSPGEDFVLVNETFRYRITRYWLAGPKAGRFEVFAENLPGFPDGISSNGRGTFWVAFFTVRNDQADRVLHPRPWLKRLLSKLPRALWPQPEPYGEPLDRRVRPAPAVREGAEGAGALVSPPRCWYTVNRQQRGGERAEANPGHLLRRDARRGRRGPWPGPGGAAQAGTRA